MKNKVVKNQKKFFGDLALHKRIQIQSDFFDEYVNKEQFEGLKWASEGAMSILDYGCGTGESVERLAKIKDIKKVKIVGVDIASSAVDVTKKKYPEHHFYTISNNKIPQVKNNTVDGAYMLHVLHHSKGHQQIFDEVYAKLRPGGRFLINDLCSNSPFIKLGRKLFTLLPGFLKAKFEDDLVVEGAIPEKYSIDIDKILSEMRKTGFNIIEVGYGHLFFFLFGWIDRFIPLSQIKPIEILYKKLIQLENLLLRKTFLKKYAELVYIKAIKPETNEEVSALPSSGDYSMSNNQYVFNSISPKTKCLDVGCWTGNLGEQLIKEKLCTVHGLDVKESVLEEAKSKGYKNIYKINLNNTPLETSAIKNKYDHIIFADVLEHLVNPSNVLEKLKANLKPKGTVIISLPNVAFFLNRILLTLGNWNYTEFGTLDKTHLKFYTLKSGKEMVESAGYDVLEVQPYNQFGMLRYIDPLTKLFPGLFAYQFIIIAKMKPND